ncbi:beta-N-acetylglucosaminidase domain-containing protein [Clostridium sp.]|uniref:beta-N-acetylglucosaminidase domain-containing protein n=1 Tax=Clostridium sp. TaxID=1506 RepID=UPI003F413C11
MKENNKSKKIVRKGMLATTFAVAIAMTTCLSPLAQVNFNSLENVDNSKVDIYPVPQVVEYLSEDGISFTSIVNVVMHGDHEEATLPKLEKILKENNIKYIISNEVVEDKTNIVVSSDKEHCEECTTEGDNKEALVNKEGYVLKISDNENENGIISILGADEDGAYYGVLTLGQVLEQKNINNKVAEVVVEDYPEIALRGFIEGFYGYPWSHEDRMSLMADTSEYKMNTYIYAPKDDPYHRSNWKELYPEDKAKEIAELAKVGTENNFNFCWTIHPGATLQFTDEDYNAILNKFEQLYSLGVRQFGVLFDDTDDWTNGGKQAEWINRINNDFVKAKGDVAPMVVVSARYNSAWGPNINRYFKPFMETLDKDVEVMWTGHATMSNVSRDVFEWPKTATGVDKDVAVWWNYPVNDYCDNRVLMAPMHNLSTDLDNVTGFFSNPMNQAEASKVALYSIADYTWNTDSFEYMQSWETSIEKLVPEVSEEFKRFASNTCYLKDDGGASGPFEFDESWYLAEKIDALNAALDNDESAIEIAKDLMNEFKLIIQDRETIINNLDNEKLLKEIEPFLGAYKALGEAGIAAMNVVISSEEGNEKEATKQHKLVSEKLELMSTFVVTSLEGEGTSELPAAVGSKRLKPLVSKIVNMYDKAVIPQRQMTATATSEHLGVVNEGEARYAIDGNENSIWHTKWNEPVLPQSITLNLGDKYVIDKYTYLPRQKDNNGIITNYELQVSTDGVNFVKVAEGTWDSNSSLKVLNFEPVEATDVRLVAKAGVGNFASAAELNVYRHMEEVEEEVVVSKVNDLRKEEVTNSSVSLVWNEPSSTVGLVEYVVYKDGKEYAKVPAGTTTLEINSLKANTIYGFKVTAKFSNGEESKPQSINVRTQK